MLKVTCNISTGDVEAFIKKAETHVMDCMKEALVNLCTECDQRARDNDGGWQNRTGNLRSSIGGAVYEKGETYFTTEFAQVLNGSRGSAKGREMVQALASQYTEAIVMTMVAGEDYAEKVEAMDSKDVIESTRLYAESVVMSRIEEAKEKAINDINSWQS